MSELELIENANTRLPSARPLTMVGGTVGKTENGEPIAVDFHMSCGEYHEESDSYGNMMLGPDNHLSISLVASSLQWENLVNIFVHGCKAFIKTRQVGIVAADDPADNEFGVTYFVKAYTISLFRREGEGA